MIKILYAHQDGCTSGSAISLSLLLKALDRSRFQPRVLLAREGAARNLFETLDVPVEVVPAHGFWTSPSLPFYHPDYYRNFKALTPNRPMEDYLRRQNPDLVHINDKALLPVGMAANRLGLPVVWHLRSAYAGGRSRLLNSISRSIISRIARHAIAISEDEVEGFDRRIPVDVVYNTVDFGEADEAVAQRAATRRQLGLGEHEIAVSMVGYLTETKGAWDFIRAAGMVLRARPDLRIRFVMVAPIPGREPLNWGWRGRLGLVDKTHPEDRVWHLAREVGIEGHLLLTGGRTDVMKVLAAMEIVSVCYRLWAVGRPAFEGMAAGRPVIVNEGHSGRSGVVRDRETGFVVPRANPEALADAIIKLATDPSLRRRMGQSGFMHARQKFDANRNARKIEAIYGRVLQISPEAQSLDTRAESSHCLP